MRVNWQHKRFQVFCIACFVCVAICMSSGKSMTVWIAPVHTHIPFQSVEHFFYTCAHAFTTNAGVRSSQRVGWHRDLLRTYYIYRVAHFCSFCRDTHNPQRIPHECRLFCVCDFDAIQTPHDRDNDDNDNMLRSFVCIYFECESRREADELQRSRVVEMVGWWFTEEENSVLRFGILAITDTFQPHQSRRPHHLDGNDT